MSAPIEDEEMEPVLKAVPLVSANLIERETEASTSIAVRAANNTREGFSTSICGLFQDPYSRSDCCAFNCCGLLSIDRTRYLLTKEQPSWTRRILLYVVAPWGTMQLFNILISFYATEDVNTAVALFYFLLLLAVAWISYVLFILRSFRRETREIVVRKLYQNRMGLGSNIQAEMDYLKRQTYEIEIAHPCCCGKYPPVFDSQPMFNDQDYSQDFCSNLWYCGYRICGLCQCFGLCAIGQEEREVKNIVSAEDRLIDYVTFQPYNSYYPGILALRSDRNVSLMDHFKAISNLSSKLLKALAIYLALDLALALTDMTGSALAKLFVLLATFGQAFLVLYFVHWRWHKFDLSVDAVIKYFSYGFLLTTGIAIVWETLISFFVNLIFAMVYLVSLASSTQDANFQKPEDVVTYLSSFAKNHQYIFILYFFVNSFLIAALVEEVAKYFAFWSMEHPDFLEISSPPERQAILQRSRQSYGAAITVAMVAAATGFACCEDLGYIFGPSTSFADEMVTLIVRSLLPVHQICAAIQSIGVCRRELEGEKEWTIGRCLWPAVFLHGLFDFYVFVLSFEFKLSALSNLSPSQDDGSNVNILSADDQWVNNDTTLGGLFIFLNIGVPFIIAACGFAYYIHSSRLQTVRLKSLDSESQSTGQESPESPTIVAV